MNELTGADFKSATADDNKKLFIETYGCQMNVADTWGEICIVPTEVSSILQSIFKYSLAHYPRVFSKQILAFFLRF